MRRNRKKHQDNPPAAGGGWLVAVRYGGAVISKPNATLKKRAAPPRQACACKARAVTPTPKLPNASCLMSVQSLSPTPSFPCKPPPLRHSRVEPSPPLRHSRAGGNLCLGLKAALDSRLRGNDGNKRQFSRVGDLSPTRMLEAAQQVTPLYPSPCKQRQHKPRINHHQ